MLSILLVEDDIAIRELLKDILEQADFEVLLAGDTQKALTIIQQKVPDLLLLDWMLPGMSGIEWARRLRKDERYTTLPIIMLTARGEVEDKIRSLDTGLDDHITKPFSSRELVARVRAVLRRSGKLEKLNRIEAGGVTLISDQHRVLIKGTPVNISPTEYRLLEFFLNNQDRLYTRSQLLDHVWGRHSSIEERTVDVHIRRLRKLLSEFEQEYLIQTVRGFGYRFSEQR